MKISIIIDIQNIDLTESYSGHGAEQTCLFSIPYKNIVLFNKLISL